MLSQLSSFAPALLLLPCAAAGQEALVPFDVPQVQLGAYTAPFQRLLDFDADGDLDAVGAHVSTSGGTPYHVQAKAYSNAGNGAYQDVWSETWSVPAGMIGSKAHVAVGDLDGDGYDDFALALDSELWRLFSNAPAPGFTRVIEGQVADIRSIAVADFDGDGTDDVALQLGTTIEVHLAAGGVLTASSIIPIDIHDHLIAADTDGDPLPDVVRVSGVRMQPFIVLGSSLVAAPPLTFAAYGPMVDGGDVDGDGDTDLVAFHMAGGGNPPRVEIFRRIAPLQWMAEPPYTGGPAEYLADIDGDGDPDGVCCGGGGSGGTYPSLDFASTFELALNQDGVFDESFQIPGIGSKSLAGAQDVDGDGDTDLVAGRCVYFNRGWWKGVPSSVLVGVDSVEECADLDTDGDLDPWLEVPGAPLIEPQSWRSRGDGTFALQPMVMDPAPAGEAEFGPRIQGDFDGDGDTDVIMALHVGPFGAFLYQGLWRNSGGGSFHFSGPCAPAGVSFFVDSWKSDQAYLVGDFEADGDLDLVMRHTPASWSSSYGETFVYRNDGQAFFQAGPSFSSTQAKVITDFDLDGYNDLITTAAFTPGGVQLLRGLPAGSGSMFAASVPLSGWWGLGKTQYVDVGDYNQDGYPDLASAGANSNAHIYLNGIPLGMGTTMLDTVLSRDELEGYWGDPRVLSVDANGDGRLDFVAGPFEAGRSWRVYLQKASAGPTLGTAAFEPGVGVVLSPLLCDDADGDGDTDIVGDFVACSLDVHGADAGARQQYGAGSPGSGGVVPTLGATGPFRVGETLQLRLRGAHGQLAYLGVSHAGASVPGFLFPGLTLLIDPTAPGFVLAWPVIGSGGPGEGAFDVTVAIQPGWAGLELYHQVLVLDAGAPNGLLSASNGLRILYGP